MEVGEEVGGTFAVAFGFGFLTRRIRITFFPGVAIVGVVVAVVEVPGCSSVGFTVWFLGFLRDFGFGLSPSIGVRLRRRRTITRGCCCCCCCCTVAFEFEPFEFEEFPLCRTGVLLFLFLLLPICRLLAVEDGGG